MGPWAVVLMQSCICLFMFRMIIQINARRRGIQRSTMIVLGSGGHTAEMFKFLSTLEERELRVNFTPRHYVIAKTDDPGDSEAKAKAFEEARGSGGAYFIHRIPRSREVGQSYFTSIFTTLISFVSSFLVVWKTSPEVVLANGPGTCLPICISAYITRILGRTPVCCIALSESYACRSHASLSTRLLNPFVDVLFVQWPNLIKLYPKAIYSGRLPISEVPKIKESDGPKKHILVTVGSTKFDALIDVVDTIEFGTKAKKLGYTGLIIQYGRGKAPQTVTKCADRGFEVECFSRKNSIISDIQRCSLVIGHAGVGTIFDTLENRRNILVVPNMTLMNNHQIEIANEMESRGYVRSSSCEKLLKDLEVVDFSTIREFPLTETQIWKSMLMRHCGITKSPNSNKKSKLF